jgi:hypothetical protein
MKQRKTIAEAGQLGGKQTLKRYGKKHFKDLAMKRWKNNNKATKRNAN